MKDKKKGTFLPEEIEYHPNLSYPEKYIISKVFHYKKGCWISNETLAKGLGVGTRQASRVVNSLIKKGYLTRFNDTDKSNGKYKTKRILYAHLTPNKKVIAKPPEEVKAIEPIEKKEERTEEQVEEYKKNYKTWWNNNIFLKSIGKETITFDQFIESNSN